MKHAVSAISIMPLISRFHRRLKTPTVIQMEAAECGAAALAMILGYWGKFVPLEELRVECGVSRDGSKAGNIAKAARKYGLIVKACRFEPEELATIPLPAILHWNFNHFVVLEGFGKHRVYLNDPEGGPYQATEEEFDRAFTGVTLMFEPSPEFKPSGRRRSMPELLKKSVAGISSPLAFLFLLSFLLAFPGLAVPYFSKFFVDHILPGRIDGWMPQFLAGLSIVAAFLAVTYAVRRNAMNRLESELSKSSSGSFLQRLFQLPVEYFMQRFAGDIAERVSYNDLVSELVTGRLASTTMDLVMAVFFLVMMFVFSPVLALCGAGIALMNLLFLYTLSQKRANQQRKLLSDEGKFFGATVAGLEMMETVKAGGLEADLFAEWTGYQAKLLNAEQAMGGTLQLLNALPVLLCALDGAVILALGAARVMAGQMTVGTLVAFQGLLAGLLLPINRLVGFADEIQDLKVYLERLEDVYDYPTTKETSAQKELGTPEKLDGRVELRGVSFGYSKLEQPLIENFSMTLKPGGHIAIVGGTGSGKSTLAKLIAGLYEPWSGEILFDGKPRAEIPACVMRQSLSMVDQEISIFEGTVRDNLTMWNPAVGGQELESATRDACIREILLERQGGFDQPLGENGRCFSGGEKQRLEIARALCTNPTVLLLDEATSALDPLTEKEIMDHIRRRGCSCVIVAHRLSTVMDCDEIIVLDHGRVAERGTHAQLLSRGGVYAKLVSNA
ncbi:MAG: NHLP family bacteriocin export ABC transporter peptidase/permease/ATPase subunit [Christensenella sp.]|nr:NHLP family bacteriocin export ABC transporter peptidase/permease/ATPase subunit [Christensenella sp.]